MIKVNSYELKKIEMRLGKYKSKAPVVMSRALNRAAANANKNARMKPKSEYNIKSNDVKSTLSIKKANRSNLGAVVKSKGEKVPLDKFKVSPKQPRPQKPPKVLKVAVKKDGYKKLKSAFVADISGYKVFKRTGKFKIPDKGKYAGKNLKREIIQRIYGPAVPSMLKNKDVRNYIEKEAVDTFHKRLDHEIKRVLESGK